MNSQKKRQDTHSTVIDLSLSDSSSMLHVENAVAHPSESVFLLDRNNSSDNETTGNENTHSVLELHEPTSVATTPTHVQPAAALEELRLEEDEHLDQPAASNDK